MRITVFSSDPRHPVRQSLVRWCDRMRASGHETQIVNRSAELLGGDMLFLISAHEIVGPAIRAHYRWSLVIHASDLPRGRGWSPLVWQILEGAQEITVSLLEATDSVDAGPIWRQQTICFAGHELHDELHATLFRTEVELMTWAVEHAHTVQPRPQPAEGATYYRRRGPADSRIDPSRSLAGQFELLRVSDPVRYPAFFDLRGKRYLIQIRKVDEDKR